MTLLTFRGNLANLAARLFNIPTMKRVNDDGHVIGEDHHRAKLTDAEVDLIHEMRAARFLRREIAEKLEISEYTVREILAGRRRSQTATGVKRL